jgi:ATP-dependent Clp protease adaptor protein ClpS
MQISMAQDDDDKNDGRPGVGLATRTRPKTQKPSLYKVLLLNDDYTPMEFVIHVLKAFFQKRASASVAFLPMKLLKPK